MKVLLIGVTGQIGHELNQALRQSEVFVTAMDRASLDLADVDAFTQVVAELRPDVLINAAAYTAVDKAESEPELAFAINATAPGVMAECMRQLGGVFVHYSTDYVFDGTKSEAYVEDDPTAPPNLYGASKLAGEKAVMESGVAHLIFRTTWIYDLRGHNFLNTICRLASERPELRIVADQFGAPTWSRRVARATAQVVQKCFENDASRERLRTEWSGVYHLTAGGRTSWYEFASAIVEALARKGLAPPVPVVPISTAEYPTPARRPANSVLSNQKVRQVFGVEQVDWRVQLEECLGEMV